MIITIFGVLKKRQEDDRKKYSHRGDQYSICDFYDYVVEAFYKYSQEGEMIVPNVGHLILDQRTRMNINKL